MKQCAPLTPVFVLCLLEYRPQGPKGVSSWDPWSSVVGCLDGWIDGWRSRWAEEQKDGWQSLGGRDG